MADMIPLPEKVDPALLKRRDTGSRVRDVRDRLTSSTGTTPAFDQELLRLFAVNRISGSIPIFLLVAAMGGFAALVTEAFTAGMWTIGVLAIHGLIVMRCRRYLVSTIKPDDIRVWRTQFVLWDALFAMSWVFNVLAVLGGGTDLTDTAMLCVTLMIVAVSTMLSSSLPQAALAGSLPVTVAVAAYYALQATTTGYVLAAMVVAGQTYFYLMAQRLFRATLSSLEARAEKDALIGELEQAKANSDEARRRAEDANIAKSRFLAQMSHELRTPLNAILGFSEVMKTEILGQHSVPTYREYADDIHASGQHLLNLINEILDLSRVEAGRYELNEEPVMLAYVAEDCHHLLKMRASNRGIAIREVFEPDMPRLWADERAIRQITLNLLSNAIKFTPQGGEVRIKVGWTAAGGQYLSVVDTGPGIPEEEIPIVLSSFGQGTNAIKSAEQGTGLGLPIVNGLVELHGGTFSLKSKLRVGTEVTVTFPPERVMSALAPIAEKMARAVEIPASEAPPATGMTGAEVAEMRRRMMKRAG